AVRVRGDHRDALRALLLALPHAGLHRARGTHLPGNDDRHAHRARTLRAGDRARAGEPADRRPAARGRARVPGRAPDRRVGGAPAGRYCEADQVATSSTVTDVMCWPSGTMNTRQPYMSAGSTGSVSCSGHRLSEPLLRMLA